MNVNRVAGNISNKLALEIMDLQFNPENAKKVANLLDSLGEAGVNITSAMTKLQFTAMKEAALNKYLTRIIKHKEDHNASPPIKDRETMRWIISQLFYDVARALKYSYIKDARKQLTDEA